MSNPNDIFELLPLLAAGKLSAEDTQRAQAAVAVSPQLQKELSFWSGIYSIRRDLPRFDFSAHISPEALDRFAHERLNKFAPEYSAIAAHLQHCDSCTQDVELLRQSASLVPEDAPLAVAAAKPGLLDRWFKSTVVSRLVAPAALALVAVFAAVVIFNQPVNNVVHIELSTKFEKRSIVDELQIPEMPVSLKQGTRELVITFPTDRVDVPDYSYDLNLIRRGGETLTIEGQAIDCSPTELTNRCELHLTDQQILGALKQGGSFSLSVKEEFPAGVELVPAEYEFYFRVSVSE